MNREREDITELKKQVVDLKARAKSDAAAAAKARAEDQRRLRVMEGQAA